MNKCETSARDVSPTCVRRRRARKVLPDDVVGGQHPTEEPEHFRSGHSHAESRYLFAYRVLVPDDILALPVEIDPRTPLSRPARRRPVTVAITIQH